MKKSAKQIINNIFNNSHIRIIFFLCTCFVFTNCTKLDESIVESTGNEFAAKKADTYYGVSLEYANSLIDKYAKVLANSMSEISLRDAIKQNAMQKFDGDYDVLVSSLHKIQYGLSGMTISSLLKATYEQLYGDSWSEFEATLLKIIPNLQVSVPVHCDEWNTSATRPKVVGLPIDFNEAETSSVCAYGTHETETQISTKTEPETPVIVVSVSERVNRAGKLFYGGPIFKAFKDTIIQVPSHLVCEYSAANAVRLRWPLVNGATGYSIYQTDEAGNDVLVATLYGTESIYNSTGLTAGRTYQYMIRAFDDNGYSPYSNVSMITATNRTPGDSLILASLQFSKAKLSSVECFLRGAPEIMLRIYSSSDGGDSTVLISEVPIITSSRSSVTNSPLMLDYELFLHGYKVATTTC